jgi:hypothetical protein
MEHTADSPMIRMQPRRTSQRALASTALLSATLFGAVFLVPMPVLALPQLSTLMTEGKTELALRYRFEYVDQDDFDRDAKASTLRTRLAFESGEIMNMNFRIEVDDIREVIWRDFNAGEGNTPNRTQYPVVADVKGTEVNQAYLNFQAAPGLDVRLGRQRILLDNQRFVGAVGWRQNEQTFDAIAVNLQQGAIRGHYSYIDRVNRIFGEQVPAGRHDHDGTHLLNLSLQVGDIGRIATYLYWIDNPDAAATSTRTAGLRWEGKQALGELQADYALEYAYQEDVGDNPVSYSADYFHFSGSVNRGPMTAGIGFEQLDGDADNAGRAFRTPLATLHAFNGRTDKFLNTPDAGLRDAYLRKRMVINNKHMEARFHHFSTADGGDGLGREWSLAMGRSIGPHLSTELIVADFKGRNGFDDTRKIWVMFGARF